MTTLEIIKHLVDNQNEDYQVVITEESIKVFPTYVRGRYAQHFESLDFLEGLIGKVQILNGYDSDEDSVYLKFIAR